MNTYDPQKAARVWQRVQESATPLDSAGQLPALIAGEWADAVTYLQLSHRYQGREAQLLRRLFEQEQSHAACLKGIYTLLTGQRLVTQTPAPRQENLSVALRRCYGREMRALAQYEARQNDPQYGHVFRMLARQEQAKRAKTQLPLFRQQRIRKIVVDPVAVTGIAVAVMMMVVMIVGAISIHNAWTQHGRMAAYVQTLTQKNTQLEQDYRRGYDPADIREKHTWIRKNI